MAEKNSKKLSDIIFNLDFVFLMNNTKKPQIPIIIRIRLPLTILVSHIASAFKILKILFWNWSQYHWKSLSIHFSLFFEVRMFYIQKISSGHYIN